MNGARRAMTLIELLVSLALLGMLASLASLMWTQLRGWSDDTTLAQTALRPHRVHQALDEQWNRRAHAGEEQTFGRVHGDQATLAFITHAPILHRDWAMVEAVYRVEPRTPQRPARLVYEENRLGPDFSATRAVETIEPLVLLEHIEEASLRFRAVITSEQRGQSVSEERWVDAIDSVIDENIQLKRVELRARVKGESLQWVGVAEPLR